MSERARTIAVDRPTVGPLGGLGATRWVTHTSAAHRLAPFVTLKVEVARVSTPNDESRHITGVQVRNAASMHAAPPSCELVGTGSPPSASEPHERGADAASRARPTRRPPTRRPAHRS
jgi:hypothetical protein